MSLPIIPHSFESTDLKTRIGYGALLRVLQSGAAPLVHERLEEFVHRIQLESITESSRSEMLHGLLQESLQDLARFRADLFRLYVDIGIQHQQALRAVLQIRYPLPAPLRTQIRYELASREALTHPIGSCSWITGSTITEAQIEAEDVQR